VNHLTGSSNRCTAVECLDGCDPIARHSCSPSIENHVCFPSLINASISSGLLFFQIRTGVASADCSNFVYGTGSKLGVCFIEPAPCTVSGFEEDGEFDVFQLSVKIMRRERAEEGRCKCTENSTCNSYNHHTDWCYVDSVESCTDAVSTSGGGAWSEQPCCGSELPP
jgi:hypothetical protein